MEATGTLFECITVASIDYWNSLNFLCKCLNPFKSIAYDKFMVTIHGRKLKRQYHFSNNCCNDSSIFIEGSTTKVAEKHRRHFITE